MSNLLQTDDDFIMSGITCIINFSYVFSFRVFECLGLIELVVLLLW